MKAKTVNETLDFQRGKGAKSIFDEEIKREIIKTMEEGGWNWWEPDTEYTKKNPKAKTESLNHNLDWAIRQNYYKYIPDLIRMGGDLQDVIDKNIEFTEAMYPEDSDHCLAASSRKRMFQLIEDMKKYGYIYGYEE